MNKVAIKKNLNIQRKQNKNIYFHDFEKDKNLEITSPVGKHYARKKFEQ